MTTELCNCDLFDLLDFYSATGQSMIVNDKELLVQLFSQICESVQALHSLNYCHLDLKLENVLVGKDFNMRLCDFGFAQHMDKHLSKRVGTEYYIAPEMWDEGKLHGE